MTATQDRPDIEYKDAPPAVNFGSMTTATGTAPPVAQDVTYERILDARSEPQNWLTYYGAYDGQRYSPLDQINTENITRVTPAWVFSF
ncbi:MAG: PQQ-dependent dehydrogenase, methanol/ethanol family, partial [Modestobacter sp.]|nr:PQQ-dependent dehydrogenase, methanol/ethanol family [Modestobacter sp.]